MYEPARRKIIREEDKPGYRVQFLEETFAKKCAFYFSILRCVIPLASSDLVCLIFREMEHGITFMFYDLFGAKIKAVR